MPSYITLSRGPVAVVDVYVGAQYSSLQPMIATVNINCSSLTPTYAQKCLLNPSPKKTIINHSLDQLS